MTQPDPDGRDGPRSELLLGWYLRACRAHADARARVDHLGTRRRRRWSHSPTHGDRRAGQARGAVRSLRAGGQALLPAVCGRAWAQRHRSGREDHVRRVERERGGDHADREQARGRECTRYCGGRRCGCNQVRARGLALRYEFRASLIPPCWFCPNPNLHRGPVQPGVSGNEPEFLAAVETVANAGKENGKPILGLVFNPDMVKKRIEQGWRLMLMSGDLIGLISGQTSRLITARTAVKAAHEELEAESLKN